MYPANKDWDKLSNYVRCGCAERMAELIVSILVSTTRRNNTGRPAAPVRIVV